MPFTIADEKTTLVSFLNYLRESAALKAEGLGEDAVRRPAVPSGTSLLGLVRHLAWVERYWFGAVLRGDPVDWSPETFAIPDAMTPEQVIEDYRDAVEESNAVVREVADLNAECAREHHGHRVTVRWVLVHLIEETARHAGHADIIRELSDGAVGR
ncbi:MAG: DUF664 domain-containing protein [Propionibacteriales bacterium]|nr:DUF664 domain-containing protein [Propionibacteriales bacterium]